MVSPYRHIWWKWVLYFLKLSLKKFLNPKTLLSSVSEEKLKLKANQLLNATNVCQWIHNTRIVRILGIVTPSVDNCSQKIRWDLNNLQLQRNALSSMNCKERLAMDCRVTWHQLTIALFIVHSSLHVIIIIIIIIIHVY